MKKEIITCDFCEKECGDNYASIYLCSENQTIGRHDFCVACYSRMRMALNNAEKEVKKVDYDADECCASCRHLFREKGEWKCRLNNLERDITDPTRRHCLGYEDVRKAKQNE